MDNVSISPLPITKLMNKESNEDRRFPSLVTDLVGSTVQILNMKLKGTVSFFWG